MIDVPRSRQQRILLAARLAAGLSLSSLVVPATVAAQAVMPAANPDADRLGEVVRRLGASPRDLSALIEAGELSFRLGDATAAAAFYKRAEAIDPNNGRVKGGIARILVNGERPGEALRYFDLAQRFGAPMARYADDRGLAYDLIGEQDRAQREYRVAMAQGGQEADEIDEIRRRYALSLGISGQQQEALAQIDALLRRSDRGAWRARAFILAMGGDVTGANRIATSMMPPGMASGLAAFFRRLPTLGATDRAFAVHFGEVAPTAARLADARMVPALPVLGPDPTAPRRVETAAVAPAANPVAEKRLSRSEQRRRDREAARAQQTAAAAAPRPTVAGRTPTPSPASVASSVSSPASAGSSPLTAAQVAYRDRTNPPPAATYTPAPTAALATSSATVPPPRQVASIAPRPAVPNPTPAPSTLPASTRVASTPTPTPLPGSTSPSIPVASTPTPASALTRAPTSPAAPGRTSAPAAVAATPTARPTPPRLGEDSILARIVAGISVPGSELGIAPPPSRVPVIAAPPAPSSASLDEAAQAAERNVAADDERRQRLAVAKQVAQKSATEKPVTTAERPSKKAVPSKASGVVAPDEEETTSSARDRKAGKAKDLASKDAPARNAKDSETKKAVAEKESAGKKAERAEPSRIWVQVAGGANQGDLPKAWKGAQSKAKALAGRRAYVTPSRATNRVVTGPFKTEAEARAFVNTLSKQGLSAFTFTSDAGQKMTRVDGK